MAWLGWSLIIDLMYALIKMRSGYADWPVGVALVGTARSPWRTALWRFAWCRLSLLMRFLRWVQLSCLKILEQPVESLLKSVMVLPVREVRDEVFADLHAEILAAVRIEAFPVPDHLEVHQPDREKLRWPSLISIFRALRISVLTHSLFMLFGERTRSNFSYTRTAWSICS